MREAQYNILLGQTGELVAVKAQYALLLAQFTALGAIAVVSSDNDRKKVDVCVNYEMFLVLVFIIYGKQDGVYQRLNCCF